MSCVSGPSEVTNGLIFHIDANNTNKSWKGANTTNLAAGVSFGGSTLVSVSNVFDTLPDGSSGIVQESTALTGGDGNRTGTIGTYTLTEGLTYTLSFYIKNINCTGFSGNLYSPTLGSSISTIIYPSTPTGIWTRVVKTFTVPINGFGTISFAPQYYRDGGYGTFRACWPQLEQKSFATPYVNGSRSTTQSIFDLTNPSTIIDSRATYNSDGTFSFNGTTSNYLNVTRSDLIAGSWPYTNVTAVAWLYIDPASIAGENNIATVESSWEYKWINNQNGTASVWYASNPWAWYGSGTVNTGVWQMITFRHGPSIGDIWCNNSQVFSQAISGTIGVGSSSYPYLTLMGRLGGPGSNAMGKLGQFLLFNRAISDEEIIRVFNSTRGRFGL